MRSFMFEHVYLRPEAERQTERATRLLTDLYGHYLEHPDTMPMGASLATTRSPSRPSTPSPA